MDVLECIQTRRSIRKFKNLPVEWYRIGQILNAGSAAPTAGNLQDYRFMVITDASLKRQIAAAALEQMWIAEAPFIIIVFSEFIKNKRFYGIRGERLYTIQDAAAAVQNMLLAAHSLGLGACWVGAFDEDKINAIIGVPDYARPQAIIPVGWPNEDNPMPAKYKLENLVFFNKWADNSGKTWHPEEEMLKDWAPKFERAAKGIKAAYARTNQTLGDKISAGAKGLHEKIKQKFK